MAAALRSRVPTGRYAQDAIPIRVTGNWCGGSTERRRAVLPRLTFLYAYLYTPTCSFLAWSLSMARSLAFLRFLPASDGRWKDLGRGRYGCTFPAASISSLDLSFVFLPWRALCGASLAFLRFSGFGCAVDRPIASGLCGLPTARPPPRQPLPVNPSPPRLGAISGRSLAFKRFSGLARNVTRPPVSRIVISAKLLVL